MFVISIPLTSLFSILTRPEIKPEINEDDTVEEDESELLLERVEEEMAAVYSDDEDDHLLNVDDLRTLSGADLVCTNFYYSCKIKLLQI